VPLVEALGEDLVGQRLVVDRAGVVGLFLLAADPLALVDADPRASRRSCAG
jgi:hypothetical protein